tara:strand:+ start:1458 stop:1679 length:222 start_codon:yes stop_codon:yes gene_type:complete
MSGLSANSIVDEVIRGIAVGTVYRVVVEGRPILSMQNVNFGLKLAGANVVYSVARPVVNQVLPGQLKLPNGGK